MSHQANTDFEERRYEYVSSMGKSLKDIKSENGVEGIWFGGITEYQEDNIIEHPPFFMPLPSRLQTKD